MLIFVPSIICENVDSSLARICAWSSPAVISERASVRSRTFMYEAGVGVGEWEGGPNQPNFASMATRISSSDLPSLWRRTASFPSPWQTWHIFAMAFSPS